MAENWVAVADEIADALAEVGFAATMEEPPTEGGPEYDPVAHGFPTLHTVNVIDDRITKKDADGAVTGVRRVLTVEAGVVVPVKGWRVQVGAAWHRIASVMPLAPGGVDLLYDVELEA